MKDFAGLCKYTSACASSANDETDERDSHVGSSRVIPGDGVGHSSALRSAAGGRRGMAVAMVVVAARAVERGRVGDNDEVVARAGEGDVEALGVVDERRVERSSAGKQYHVLLRALFAGGEEKQS